MPGPGVCQALPKSAGIFLPADNYTSARPCRILYESLHMSFARGSSGQEPGFAHTKRKGGSLTFEFVALPGYDRSILFRETATTRKGDSKKISSRMMGIAAHRLQTARHVRVGGMRNFIVFQSRNLISGSRYGDFVRRLNEFYLNVKTIQAAI